MENNIQNTSSTKLDGKTNWISSIALKRLQNKPLSAEDYSFLQTMITSQGNDAYAQYIKLNSLALDKYIDEKIIEDPELYVTLKQKNAIIDINMFKAEKQGHRDDAATRKMNIDAINKYSKLARKEGYEFNPEIFGVDQPKSVTDENTIDNTNTVIDVESKND